MCCRRAYTSTIVRAATRKTRVQPEDDDPEKRAPAFDLRGLFGASATNAAASPQSPASKHYRLLLVHVVVAGAAYLKSQDTARCCRCLPPVRHVSAAIRLFCAQVAAVAGRPSQRPPAGRHPPAAAPPCARPGLAPRATPASSGQAAAPRKWVSGRSALARSA